MALVFELESLSRETARRSPSCLLYLNVLLNLNKNIPHPGDVILHQMFVEGIDDLQPIDEGGGGYILVAVVYQSHLTLEIVNIVHQAFSGFRLDCEEVVVVSLNSLREANWL